MLLNVKLFFLLFAIVRFRVWFERVGILTFGYDNISRTPHTIRKNTKEAYIYAHSIELYGARDSNLV